MQQLDAKIPDGPIAEKWDRHRMDMKLINPANRRRFNIIVVGTGLAGAAASRRDGGAREVTALEPADPQRPDRRFRRTARARRAPVDQGCGEERIADNELSCRGTYSTDAG